MAATRVVVVVFAGRLSEKREIERGRQREKRGDADGTRCDDDWREVRW